MKKVIDNKLYDTETAREVGAVDSGHQYGDFHYFEETLYCKKTGEYFLHGEGGGMSRYGVWTGNTGRGGEKIMPMTVNAAKEWAERNLDGDDYISEFGEPSEDDTRVALNLTIAATAKAKLEAARRDTGDSMSRIVEDLIMRSFETGD